MAVRIIGNDAPVTPHSCEMPKGGETWDVVLCEECGKRWQLRPNDLVQQLSMVFTPGGMQPKSWYPYNGPIGKDEAAQI